jgi:cell division protein FtsB
MMAGDMQTSSPGGRSSTPRASRRLPPDQRRRAALHEVAYLTALLLTAGALYSALVLLPSKLKTRELRARRDALTTEVKDLRGSIADLERDARALRDDPWSVERALRRRLGYLRPGERVFRP